MGYLDKNLKKRNQQRRISVDNKKEVYVDKQGREIFNNTFNSREKGYTITIFGVEEQGLKAKHRNGEITKLMLAKAIKVRNGDALRVDSADDIAFELKEGQQPDDKVLQAVAYEYERQKVLINKATCDYLGIVDYTDKGYKITQKSQKVDEYINQNVVPEILEERRARKELLADKYAKRQEQEKEREIKFLEDLDARGYVAQMQKTMKKRMENPYLRKVRQYKINGKTYEDYDGINIQTGDILRIRRLDKVGKDGDGTYLYQGYVHSTPNEDDVEFLDKALMGIPVCFDLPKRFSDIEMDNNPEEIRKILELLSDAGKYSSRKGLSYIGGIDRKGKLNHNTEPDSFGIANAIKRLNQEYAKNNGNTR